MISEIRGWRNNNPGNIRHGQKWRGLSPEQADKDFCSFISPEYGIRALGKILLTYQSTHKLNTIADIIKRYAPSTENDTDAYTEHVEKLTEVPRFRRIDLRNRYLMQGIVTAIITHEIGFNPYSDELIERGLELL